jgi:DNA-binding response OmpR family regulator
VGVEILCARVLIVDDEPMILDAVSTLLERAGFDTQTCHMWPGVAKMMRASEPSIVLLDYNMPGINGSELCSILKRNYRGEARIVLYSAEDESDLIRIVEECGADGYIRKNTPPSQLVEAIRAISTAQLVDPAGPVPCGPPGRVAS